MIRTEDTLRKATEIRIRAEEQQRADTLKSIFDAWAVTLQPRAVATSWSDVEGRADLVGGEWGRRADFVVLKRPWQHQPETERRAIHATLFHTDRPVVVVPPDRPPAQFGERVANAWREDGRTLKAVLAALRRLQRAEHVDVLEGVQQRLDSPASGSYSRVVTVRPTRIHLQ